MRARLRALRGHWWFYRRFGPLTLAQYTAVNEARSRELQGLGAPGMSHGERMLAAVGASAELVAEAKAKGYA